MMGRFDKVFIKNVDGTIMAELQMMTNRIYINPMSGSLLEPSSEDCGSVTISLPSTVRKNQTKLEKLWD